MNIPPVSTGLLIRGTVPISSAHPRDAAGLHSPLLKLMRKVCVLDLTVRRAAVVRVDVVDVEFGSVCPLDVSLEEAVMVLDVASTQGEPFSPKRR